MIAYSSQQAYFQQVWDFVRHVPYGKVVTYGQIAQSLPELPEPEIVELSGSIAKLVGNAMAACPPDVPWHRVINAQGRVSSRAEATKQVHLLEAEDLCFLHGRIDLNEYQWQGLNQPQRPKQQQLF